MPSLNPPRPQKVKLNFSSSALFHMKTRVCLKYFVNDCRYLDNNVTSFCHQIEIKLAK